MEIKNEILQQIWNDRYRKNDETLNENLDRVAKYCATNVDEYSEFYNIMNEGLFFPAGRTMSNAGIGKELTLNNCFTLNFVEDSIEDIFDKVKMAAKTHQRGGGTGFEFSMIRPNGTPTSNDAIASGVVSFLNVFDSQTATINQGSRRGANMGVLSVYHPDIVEYINAKSYDEGKLTHFNLSVMVDDDFMVAMKQDEEILLHYPIYDEKGFMIKDEDKWITKTPMKAKELWDMIIRKAYDNGEPGILFYENMNRDNNVWYIENIVNTNPCFTGDMKLLTKDGYKTFAELDGKNVEVVNINGEITNGKVWCNGEKETIKLILSNNHEITCTPDHRFMTIDEKEIEAQSLKGKKIMPFTGEARSQLIKTYIKYGFIQGDGCLGRLNSDTHKGLEVNIGAKDMDLMLLFQDDSFTGMNDRKIYLQGYNDELSKLGFDPRPLPERDFPKTYSNWSINEKASFLHGCYSANGSVIKKYRVAYKATSLTFAKNLMKTLEEDFGIKSYMTINKPKEVEFSNGTYLCKESYDVNIGRYKDLQKFHQEIGFYHLYKKIDLRKLLIHKTPYVRKIVKNKIEKVYDFNEPKTHWGVVEGYIAHNCGEYLAGVLFGNVFAEEEPNLKVEKQIISQDYKGACNLGSVFIHNTINNPFTSKAEIDYKKLEKAVKTGVKFLDNIVEINKFPLKDYENYQKNLRTIGLGITGLADALAMLNVKYGSTESIEITDKIMNFIAKTAYKTSVELAKEKGSFPFLDKKKFIQSGFIKKHIEKDQEWQQVSDDILKYGIRNARLISVAPTGTLSLTYGNNCSSGCEPIFSLEYDRKVKIGGQDESNARIVKMQDCAYKTWKEVKSDNIVDEDVFVTAQNLTVKEHLDILSIVAFHTDMSVSKTINLPTEYSFEDTKKVYEYAWKNGIKGCTIFRPNPIRQGILLINNESKQEENKDKIHTELGRGIVYEVDEDLIGKKAKLMTGCGSLHLQAWFDPITGDMMEVFLAKGSSGGCAAFMVGLSRMISLALRGGVHIESIVDQLSSVPTCPSYSVRTVTKRDTSKGNCCPTAIGNILIQMQNEIRYELGLDDDSEIIVKPKQEKKQSYEKKTDIH